MSVVTFSNLLEEHIMIPWEDRMNFDMLDVIRERIRVNKLWLEVIKQIKQQMWRREHPKKIKRKQPKDKKRLKELTRFIIKEDTSP